MDDITDYDDALSSFDERLTQGEAEEQAFEELAATPAFLGKWFSAGCDLNAPIALNCVETDFWGWPPQKLLAVVMTGTSKQVMHARWELQRQFQRAFDSEINRRAGVIWNSANVREAA